HVVSLDDASLTTGHATHFWRTPLTDTSVATIRTRTGRCVTTSWRHPFLTPEGWKPARELRAGDRVAVARRIGIAGESQPLPRVPALNHDTVNVDRLRLRPGRKYDVAGQRRIITQYLDGKAVTAIAAELGMRWERICQIIQRYGINMRWRRTWAKAPARTSPAFWRWFGYFTAEGYAYEATGSYRISIANTDAEVRADYIGLSRELFAVEPRTRGNDIYFDAINLRPFFESLGWTVPTNSATKSVPELLFKCPDEEIAAFLQAYFDGDGTVDGRTGVYATTKSWRLAHQVQMLLSRLGSIGFVRSTYCRATNGRMTEKQEYAQLGIYADDVVALARWLRFRCAHKQRNLETLVSRRTAGKHPSNWDTVPVPPPLFRMVRTGLGLTQESSGRASSVNSIENGYTEPTRQVIRYFVDVFRRLDIAGRL